MSVLETLEVVVRGDAASYVAAMRQSVEQTKQAQTAISGQFDQLKDQFTSLGQSVTSMSGVMNTALSALAMGGLTDMINTFASWEVTQVQLTAAIEAGGHAVNDVLPEYKAFAAQMAEITTTARGTTLSLLAQAEGMGLSGAAAERAVKNAIALASRSAAGSASSFIRQTVGLEEGRPEMLQRILPGIRGIKDESEKTAKAQDFLNKMFAQSEAITGTYDGQVKQLKNSLLGLKSEFGEIAEQGALPMVEALKGVVDWFRKLDDSDKRILVGALAAVTGLVAMKTALGLVAAAGVVVTGAIGSTIKAVATLGALMVSSPAALILTAGVGLVAAAAYHSHIGEKEANERKKRLDEIREYYAEELALQQGQAKADLEGALSRGTPDEQREKVQALLKDQQEGIKTLQEQMTETKERIARAGRRGRNDPNVNVKELNTELEGLKAQLADAEKNASALGQALLKLRAPWESQRFKDDLDNFTDELKKTIDTIGLTPLEKKLAEFERRAGANAPPEVLAESRSLTDQYETAKILHDQEQTAEKLTRQFDLETESLEMTAEAARVYKAELDAVGRAVMTELDAARKRNELAKENKKIREDTAQALGRLAGELDDFGKTAGQKAYKQVLDIAGDEGTANQARNLAAQIEARKTALEFATPDEKIATRMKDLNEQFVRGRLGPEVYARAVMAARKEVEGLTTAVEAMDFKSADVWAMLLEQGRDFKIDIPDRRGNRQDQGADADPSDYILKEILEELKKGNGTRLPGTNLGVITLDI